MIVRELVASLGMKVDGSGFKAADAFMAKISSGLNAVGANVGALFSPAGVLGQIQSAFGDVNQETLRLERSARTLGMPAQAIQGFDFAARAGGAEAGDFASAVQHLGAQMQAAATGSTHATMALGKMGVRLRESNGTIRDQGEVFKDFADKISKMPDGLKKTALVQDVYGQSGVNLIGVLNMGGAAIEEMQRKVKAFGAEFSPEDLKNMASFRKELATLDLVRQGFKKEAASPLASIFGKSMKDFTDWAEKEKGAEKLGKGFQSLSRWGGIVTSVLKGIYTAGRFVGEWIDGFAIGLGSLLLIPVVGWLASLVAGFVSGGILVTAAWALVIGGFLLLGIAIDEVWTLLQGGETVIGEMFPKLAKDIKEIADLFRKGNWEEAFYQIGQAWLRMLDDMAQATWKWIETNAGRLKKGVLDVIDPFGSRFKAAAEAEKNRPEAEGRAAGDRLQTEDEQNRIKFSQDPFYKALRAGKSFAEGFGVLGPSIAGPAGPAPSSPGVAALRAGEAAGAQAGGAAGGPISMTFTIPAVQDPVLAAQLVRRQIEEWWESEKENVQPR